MLLEHKELLLAEKALEKGDVITAKKIFEKLSFQGIAQAKEGLEKTLRVLLLRQWKQGKIQELSLHKEEKLSLAIARLQGHQALHALSLTEHKDAFLASLSINPSVKSALILMRQHPHFKDLSEGWISLLKKDFPRAKASFLKALTTEPKRAKLALSITEILEGNLMKGSKRLGSFLKIAPFRFPKISFFLGKNEKSSIKLSASFFYRASLEELKQFHLTMPLSKEDKGWVHLRIGDLSYAQNPGIQSQQALSYWHKAAAFHPKLQLDVLKREYIASFQNQDSLPAEALVSYFHVLYRKDVPLATSFLEELLLHHQDLHHYMKIPFFTESQKKWNLENPPEELAFLALAIMRARYTDFLYNKMPFFFTKKEEVPNLFLSSFNTLDQHYASCSFYWTVKTDICRLAGLYSTMRASLARLLEIEPLQRPYLLPKYAELAFLTKNLAEQEIQKEILHLSFLFPGQFDLGRLLFAFQISTVAENYSNSFSPALQKALFLQKAIDLQQNAQRLLQECLALYQQDEEADCRLWHAIAMAPCALFKKLKRSFLKNLNQNSFRKKIFIFFAKYTELELSEAFLSYCNKNFRGDWEPSFFLSLKALNQNDLEKALSLLNKLAFFSDENNSFRFSKIVMEIIYKL